MSIITEALKELRNLNESSSQLERDVFTLQKEIDDLEKEVREIHHTINKEEQETFYAYPEYQEALENQYGKWVTSYHAYFDDVEKESEFRITNKEKQAELEPKVNELQKQMSEINRLISDLRLKAEKETNQKYPVKDKEVSLKAKKELQKTSKQNLIKETKEALMDICNKLKDEGIPGFYPSDEIERYSFNNGYFFANLWNGKTIEIDSDWFDIEDDLAFDERGLENLATDEAKDFDLALDELDWEELENGWIKVPNSEWEINRETEIGWQEDNLPKVTKVHKSSGDYWNPPEFDFDYEPDEAEIYVYIIARKKVEE